MFGPKDRRYSSLVLGRFTERPESPRERLREGGPLPMPKAAGSNLRNFAQFSLDEAFARAAETVSFPK